MLIVNMHPYISLLFPKRIEDLKKCKELGGDLRRSEVLLTHNPKYVDSISISSSSLLFCSLLCAFMAHGMQRLVISSNAIRTLLHLSIHQDSPSLLLFRFFSLSTYFNCFLQKLLAISTISLSIPSCVYI
jgi:hypothetical protein